MKPKPVTGNPKIQNEINHGLEREGEGEKDDGLEFLTVIQ